jgi:cell shape-determining protein MreC
MNYLYVSKKKKHSSNRTPFIICGIIFIALILIFIFKGKIFSQMTSLWIGETNTLAATAETKYWFYDKAVLGDQIKSLEEERDNLKTEISIRDAKTALYDEFVTEIGTSTKEETGKRAKIIRRPPFTIFDTYIIDLGADDDIQVGNSAYARGILVGTVESVTAMNATVKLFSSSGNEILVSTASSTMQFQAFGIGNGAFKLQAPRDAFINIGDTVTSVDRIIELYGIVEAIEMPEGGTEKDVFVSLPFQMNRTTWLTVR